MEDSSTDPKPIAPTEPLTGRAKSRANLRPAWKKGVSPNPSGVSPDKPRSAHGFGDPNHPLRLARLGCKLADILEDAVARDDGAGARRLMHALLIQAEQGDTRALSMILDRIDGPLSQRFDLTVQATTEVIVERIKRGDVPELPVPIDIEARVNEKTPELPGSSGAGE